MMSKLTILILLVGLTAAVASSSAIKGQQPQAQPVQRLEEQAVRSVKSPVQQHSDRSPKSASAVVVAPQQQQQQQQAPVLESSKKVYNDESIRRSVSGQQHQPAAVEPIAVKMMAASPIVEPSPAVGREQPPAPVAVVPVAHKEAVAPAPLVAQPQPVAPVVASPVVPIVEPIKPIVVEQAAVPKAELPAQSERSAPIKDEKPAVVEQAAQPSVVTVEQVVPAKAPAVAVEPLVAAPAAPVPEVQPVVKQVVDSPLMAKQAPVVVAEPVAAGAAAAAVPEAAQPAKQADSPLMAKRQPGSDSSAIPMPAEQPIEVPAPDPGLVLSEPIDSTTKLLIDLDEHVQKFLPAEDKQEPAQPAKDQVLVSGVDYSPPAGVAAVSGKSSVPLVPYSSSSNVETEPIVPPLPSSIEKVEKASGAAAAPASGVAVAVAGQSATRQANHQHQNQQQVITQLLDQLDSLQNRIQDTINQLVARRRYVMSALLRPMGTYVRRVRTNLERLQNRVNQLQAAAASVGGGQGGPNRPGGFVDAAAIETIRRRIDDISKRISDIVNRIRFSLTPTSAPLNNNGRK